MQNLTKEDWAEVYYALEHKLTSPALQGKDREAREWRRHLKDILKKIGPDGGNMENQRGPLDGIDWPLLKDQKAKLLDLASYLAPNSEWVQTIDGIINLVDSIQDYAVDVMGLPEKAVFRLGTRAGKKNRRTDQEKETGIYLFVTYGDVEPEILGPYKTFEERDQAAKEFREDEGDESGIYTLTIKDGKPETVAYSGGFFEDDEEEGEDDDETH